MKKLLFLFLLFPILCFSQNLRFDGDCSQGGKLLANPNYLSPTTNQPKSVIGSFPSCVVTVYISASNPYTKASLYDINGNIIGNPITADSTGHFYFYASTSNHYDWTVTGTGITSPFGLGDQSKGTGGSSNSLGNGTTVLDASIYSGDFCTKLNSAYAALPSTGGEIDMRGLSGAQACSVNVSVSSASKPVKIDWPSGLTLTMSSGVGITLGYGISSVGTLGTNIVANTSGPVITIPNGNFYSDVSGLTVSNYGLGPCVSMQGVIRAKVHDNLFSCATGVEFSGYYNRIYQNFFGGNPNNIFWAGIRMPGFAGGWGSANNSNTIRDNYYGGAGGTGVFIQPGAGSMKTGLDGVENCETIGLCYWIGGEASTVPDGPYTEAIGPTLAWSASTQYGQGAIILDTNGNGEICITAGTSDLTHPTWSVALGGTITESGGAQWEMYQGVPWAIIPVGPVGNRIEGTIGFRNGTVLDLECQVGGVCTNYINQMLNDSNGSGTTPYRIVGQNLVLGNDYGNAQFAYLTNGLGGTSGIELDAGTNTCNLYGWCGHEPIKTGTLVPSSGIQSYGSVIVNPLPTPASPTLSVVPTGYCTANPGSCSTSALYYVVENCNGGSTLASAAATITGPTTLNSTNYIHIIPPATYTGFQGQPDQWSMCTQALLKGDTAHKIGTVNNWDVRGYDDQGEVPTSYSYVAVNTTGSVNSPQYCIGESCINAWPVTKTAVGSQWLNSFNAATGAFTQTQPVLSDISATWSLPLSLSSNTLSCPTCVVATVNPSAGVLHVAGGTQTATGSAVVGSDFGSSIAALSWFGNGTGSPAAPAFNTSAIPSTMLPSTTVYGGQSNTWTTGTQDFSAVTLFKARVGSGLTTSANGDFGYDTSNKMWHAWANSADSYLFGGPISGTYANGHCVQLSNSAGVITLVDSGSANCGGGGSITWNNISNPSGTFAPSMAGYVSTFSFTSALNHAFQWNNSTAATSGASASGPIIDLSCGNEWHAAASTIGCGSIQFIPGTGTDAASNLTFTHYGSATGAMTTSFPGPISAASATLTNALTPANGGLGLQSPTPHSLVVAEGASNFNLVTSPAVNGFYTCGFNVTGSAAVDPACALSGVPVDATNPATLLYSDRANYLNWTSGTALALPAVATNFASNFPFVVQNNTAASTLTITPNAGASDLIDGASSGTLIPKFAAFVYQDSTTAPGHWFTIKLPTFGAFPACADSGGNHVNFTTSGGFTCGTSSSTGGQAGAYTAVSYSATPTFTASSNTNNSWSIMLTGNVTSSTLANSAAGQFLAFKICQDGTGSHTFAWPTGFSAATTVFPTASTCTEQAFFWDGSNAQPFGPAQVSGSSLSALMYGPTGTAPGTPPSGFIAAWFDSTDNALKVKNSAGTVTAAVGLGSCTNKAVTGISDSGGPTCTTLTSAYVDNSIALTGTDINTSNQVTATHLASPLPVSQGGTGSAIADTTVAVSGGTQGANSCSSATSVAMTGLTTSMVVLSGYSATPAAATGWGSTGGMVFQAWPDSAGTMKWIVCNQTASSITYGAITFNVGAR